MLASRIVHAPVCASCRLRGAIAAKQLLRSRKPLSIHRVKAIDAKSYAVSSRTLQQRSELSREDREAQRLEQEDAEAEEEGMRYAKQLLQDRNSEKEDADAEAEEGVRYAERLLQDGIVKEDTSPEKAALLARERYGARLPEGVLGEEGYRVYERLYGRPLAVEEVDGKEEGGVRLNGVEEDLVVGEEGEERVGTGVLREVQDGELEEVGFEVDEGEEEEMLEDEEDLGIHEVEGGRMDDDMRLRQDIQTALSAQHAEQGFATAQEEEPSDPQERAHPLTTATRFGTTPSSLPLPTTSLLEPITAQLANTNNKHLTDAAHRTLGGIGLPYSPSTPARAKTLQQKPIQIDAFQHNVSDIEGDVFLAAILPGVYASVMSVLTETRKRLGTAWAEGLVRKAEKGEVRILDAGGAGAGVLAVREMLRAEWERMREERSTLNSEMALAEAGGQLGGPGVAPPLGTATVVTGSDVLRHRASKLLENTTFIPRLPDYVHTSSQREKGKFDLVIAPHTLWGGFRFERERKVHVQNLWSLCERDGGVLCLLEKGVSRGFEVVAGAREMLLRTRIQSAGSRGTEFDEESYEGAEIEWGGTSLLEEEEADSGHQPSGSASNEPQLVWEKEKGTVIAPCTNHVACPMYRPKGFLKGRRDVCAFEQRYVRPHFLQRILGAKDKNFEDVKLSYLSVMRGRDLVEEKEVEQGGEGRDMAFDGYEATNPSEVEVEALALQLPRQVLPPLKKKGHVLLDLCTPAGTLERWTVPRSFSKQAFRDARKSSWGDLWAMGAKTRVPRHPKMDVKHGGRLSKAQKAEVVALEAEGRRRSDREGVKGGKRREKAVVVEEENEDGEVSVREGKTVLDTDEYGRIVTRVVSDDAATDGGRGGKNVRIVKGRDVEGKVRGEGGRMRTGQKVGGLRDKRDKSGGGGNGRRRMRQGED